jgi:hypothetical protein
MVAEDGGDGWSEGRDSSPKSMETTWNASLGI